MAARQQGVGKAQRRMAGLLAVGAAVDGQSITHANLV